MASIASTSHGLPNTCTGTIADVLSVISVSILFVSILSVSGSISQNTGVHPSHFMALTVAIQPNAVVIISPFNFSALIASCIAKVPFVTLTKFFRFNF